MLTCSAIFTSRITAICVIKTFGPDKINDIANSIHVFLLHQLSLAPFKVRSQLASCSLPSCSSIDDIDGDVVSGRIKSPPPRYSPYQHSALHYPNHLPFSGDCQFFKSLASLRCSKSFFLSGKKLKTILSHHDMVEAPFLYASYCGGCKTQNLSYQAQIKYKEEQVCELVVHIGKFNQTDRDFADVIKPIVPCQEQYHCRNKGWLEVVKELMEEQEKLTDLCWHAVRSPCFNNSFRRGD